VAAAAAEFAARGFDGAKVDRIARRARVNKAMLYYHFPSKAALYQAILRDVFGAVADALVQGRAEGGPPDRQIRRFVETVAREATARPHFPSMWLREMADGGRHLDEGLLQEIRRVLEALAGILAEGRSAGVFGPAHPFITQIAIVAPILFHAATAPVRQRLGHLVPGGVAAAERDAVVAHVQTATLSALAAGAARRARPASRGRSSSR